MFFIALITPAFAQPDLEAKPWPEEFMENLPGKVDEIKYRLANAAFDGRTDLSMGSLSFGENDGLKIKFQISRDAYNNYSLNNGWTVIDRFTIRPTWRFMRLLDAKDGYAAPLEGNFYSYFGFTGTSESTFEFRDVRVMAPGEAQNLPNVKEEHHFSVIRKLLMSKKAKAKLKSREEVVPESVKPGEEGDTLETDIQDLNPYADLILNSSVAVKAKKIFNPLTIPFRIPWFKVSANTLKKNMIDGEVISYSRTGQVSFGTNFGAKFLYAPNRWPFGAELNISLKVITTSQVSIKRESADFAQVRVSTISPEKGLKNKPFTLQAKIGTDMNRLFNGVLLFTDNGSEKRVGRKTIRIVPLQLNYSETPLLEFNATYRYDLRTKEGRDAFHSAVLGNLEPSASLAEEEKTYANPAVTFITQENAHRSTTNANLTSDLSYLFKLSYNRTLDEIQAELETPNGKRHLYRSTAENRRDRRTILGASEKVSRKISIFMDDEGFKKNECGSFLILAENNIEDSSTIGSELNEYTHEVNTLFKEDIFNRMYPAYTYRDKDANPKRMKKAWHGRSSFYFGFTIKDDDFLELMQMNEAVVLEKAQKYGLSMITRDRWRELKRAYRERDVIIFKEQLRKLFEVRRKVKDTMNFITDVLPKYHKFLVAQNVMFGNIQMRGHKLSPIEKALALAEQEMGLASDTYRTVADPDAILSGLKVKPVEKGLLKVSFELANSPTFLFFRRDMISGRKDRDIEEPSETPETRKERRKERRERRKRKRKIVEFIVFNRDDRFKKGKNELILDPKDNDPVIRRLAQDLRFNDYMNLTAGYSQTAANWGYGASTQFLVPKIYEKPTPSPTPAGE